MTGDTKRRRVREQWCPGGGAVTLNFRGRISTNGNSAPAITLVRRSRFNATAQCRGVLTTTGNADRPASASAPWTAPRASSHPATSPQPETIRQRHCRQARNFGDVTIVNSIGDITTAGTSSNGISGASTSGSIDIASQRTIVTTNDNSSGISADHPAPLPSSRPATSRRAELPRPRSSRQEASSFPPRSMRLACSRRPATARPASASSPNPAHHITSAGDDQQHPEPMQHRHQSRKAPRATSHLLDRRHRDRRRLGPWRFLRSWRLQLRAASTITSTGDIRTTGSDGVGIYATRAATFHSRAAAQSRRPRRHLREQHRNRRGNDSDHRRYKQRQWRCERPRRQRKRHDHYAGATPRPRRTRTASMAALPPQAILPSSRRHHPNDGDGARAFKPERMATPP